MLASKEFLSHFFFSVVFVVVVSCLNNAENEWKVKGFTGGRKKSILRAKTVECCLKNETMSASVHNTRQDSKQKPSLMGWSLNSVTFYMSHVKHLAKFTEYSQFQPNCNIL